MSGPVLDPTWDMRPGETVAEYLHRLTQLWAAACATEAEPEDEDARDRAVMLEGTRNNALTSLAGTMRRQGMERDEIAAVLAVVNARRCHPPLPEREVAAIARSVARYAPGKKRS